MGNGGRGVFLSVLKDFAGQARMLTIPRPFLDMLQGDHLAALFLSQCMYWSDKTNDNDGWFYKTAQDWQEELCLSDEQVQRIFRKLQGLELVEKTVKKVSNAKTGPRQHWRIYWDALEQFTEAHYSQGISGFNGKGRVKTKRKTP